MPIKTFIPMSSEQIPQQRIAEVKMLPPKPKGLSVKLDWVKPFKSDRPKGTPRKVTFLCSVEWAWSPMHSRIDNYYLHSRGKRWLLWNHRLDEDNWSWYWDVHAYADKVEADEKTIALHMLRGAWLESIRHEELDHYHFIGNTGFLDVSELQAVGRDVWGP